MRFARRLKRSHFKVHTSYPKLLTVERTIIIPAYERLLFVLHGLVPPPADAVAYRRMLATFNYLDLSVHQLLDSAEGAVGNRDRSQIRRVRRLGRRVDRLGRRFDSRAANLGLTACGKP